MVRLRKRVRPFPSYTPSDTFRAALFNLEAPWREIATMAGIDAHNLRNYVSGWRPIGPRVCVKLLKLAERVGVPAHEALIQVPRSSDPGRR